jgi:hypothetical protein
MTQYHSIVDEWMAKSICYRPAYLNCGIALSYPDTLLPCTCRKGSTAVSYSSSADPSFDACCIQSSIVEQIRTKASGNNPPPPIDLAKTIRRSSHGIVKLLKANGGRLNLRDNRQMGASQCELTNCARLRIQTKTTQFNT